SEDRSSTRSEGNQNGQQRLESPVLGNSVKLGSGVTSAEWRSGRIVLQEKSNSNPRTVGCALLNRNSSEVCLLITSSNPSATSRNASQWGPEPEVNTRNSITWW